MLTECLPVIVTPLQRPQVAITSHCTNFIRHELILSRQKAGDQVKFIFVVVVVSTLFDPCVWVLIKSKMTQQINSDVIRD